MDRKKITEEGMLERYILGLLTEEEEVMLEEALSAYPLLKEELTELEAVFEQIGRENAVAVPGRVREKLRNALANKGQEVRTTPRRPASALQSGRLMVAASLAAIFALGAFWLYAQWQRSLEELNHLQVQTDFLQNRLEDLEREYRSTRERYAAYVDPDAIPLYLVANQKSPGSKITAYVNHQDKTVVVNGSGLLPVEPEKTYQMWADVDGIMINMGLVPPGQEYIPLRYIEKAESLNVTIEPAGGSEHPTVENLITHIYL